jgi:cytochrome c peroxidase
MKIIKNLAYSLPIAGLSFFIWGVQAQASSTGQFDVPPLYPSANLSLEPIQPIPQKVSLDTGIVELGEKLFKDSRMSEKGVSCTSCHNINMAGDDGLKVSIDIRGGNDSMNTPTVFNVSLNPLLTWYGRRITLEQQLEDVLANVKHMGGNWDNILLRLAKDPFYKNRFEQLFTDGLTRDNVKHAIASFERSLITPDSPFDHYLRGDDSAISSEQKTGYGLFKQYGCVACHQGINIGGNVNARLGIFLNPFAKQEKDSAQAQFNLGRYNLTGSDNDKHVFRVPSLRNVAKTAPYFHVGNIKSLEKAVKFMAKYQLGREICDEDARSIAEFLRSLTGRYNGRYNGRSI